MFHHISRYVTQNRFYRCCSYATVRIRVDKTFIDLSQSESCDLMNAYQEARDLVLRFQGI
jgi:hypothetical protein